MEGLIEKIPGIEIHRQINLSQYSSMGLKAQGDLILVRRIDALQELVKTFSQNGLSYQVLGLGANTLLREDSQVPYIKLLLPPKKLLLDDSYKLPASTPLGLLTQHALKNSIKGWEVFTGIPATLGGAIAMNAGTNLGEIGPLIKKLWIISSTGELRVHVTQDKDFSYRKNYILTPGDIITEIEITSFGQDYEIPKIISEYQDKRFRTQPLTKKTCGCIFKNTKTLKAGVCIDELRLKGLQYKGVRISPLHANFMENTGGATYSDVRALIDQVQEKLFQAYQENFETEVKLSL